MKHQDCKRDDGKNGWASMTIAGAAILTATVCGGCLYTVAPAMAGPSTNYQQPADSQPAAQPTPAAQSSQPSNGQNNQNKQQNGMPPNGAHPQGEGGTL